MSSATAYGPSQGALPLSLELPVRPRRRRARRRTGPCTVPYRVIAARQGRRMVRPAAWVRTVQADPAVAQLRADAARSLLAVVWALATAARADATSAPTWPGSSSAPG